MMHIAVAAAAVVHVVAKINLGDTKMKITKQELAEIIREEVESKLDEMDLDEQDFFEPEEDMVIKGIKGGVDEQGVPLKAPFPPGIKTTRELIKKFPYKSEERKLFRKWYKKYGPGSKRKRKGKKPKTVNRGGKEVIQGGPLDGIRQPHRRLKSNHLQNYYSGMKKKLQKKELSPAEGLAINVNYNEYRKEYNKKLGLKGKRDFLMKVGALDKSGNIPMLKDPNSSARNKAIKKFRKASKAYDEAVKHYFDTGKAKSPFGTNPRDFK